jgi:hypothetical protein
MQIEILSLRLFRNDEHFQFHTEVKNLLNVNKTIELC